VLRVDGPHTEAELTVKAIQYGGIFAIKKLFPLYQIEKCVIGNGNVADCTCPWRAERVLVKELKIHDENQLLDSITLSASVARAPEHNSTAPE
jgi:hypothetical protein